MIIAGAAGGGALSLCLGLFIVLSKRNAMDMDKIREAIYDAAAEYAAVYAEVAPMRLESDVEGAKYASTRLAAIPAGLQGEGIVDPRLEPTQA